MRSSTSRIGSRRAPGDAALAKAQALTRRYLRYGTRSVAQVDAYLTERGVDSSMIQQVIQSCLRQRALDDRAAAKLWADTLGRRGYAWAAVRQILAAKGFDARVIAATVAPMEREAPDASRLRELVRSRSSNTRLSGWLARRGFEAGMIAELLSGADASDE